ncbi:hypothetical protein DL89DRAFT_294542 [Linderina pennispora]|uniref:C2H2-type domain-containing protein n=1 Tax=Linderina pennispora TaxID=61395 RepID=A0A1Y1W464_9FUNG|nr:uncharacterized protein DL89DRAFT_294542 [Linderina pennispora]ORX68026.1 hypothetical protein DL89DRAFT_294542 [Linderina pennispora]
MADSETSAQSLRGSLEFPSIQRIKGLRRSASANSRRHPRPVITRVDAPAPITTSVPALDVLMQQRMQRKDTESWEASISDTAKCAQHVGLNPVPAIANSARDGAAGSHCSRCPQQMRGLHHDYFVVATVDGQPTVPERYQCPTAMCSASFASFEGLRAHWSQHPWNRRGVLVPVTAGGIRRLSFWQHKVKYVKSVLMGRYRGDGQGARWGKAAVGVGAVSMSDLGDISLRGPRSYLVSPRILPIEQVRKWEEHRSIPG